MARQPEEDCNMSGVDSSPAPESKSFNLTDNCHHYQRRADVPWDIQKYWEQRYSIFSLYDEGIHMTDDAWFGVTPEPVARQIASDLVASTPSSKTVVIDIFAGAGGNAIAFALSNRWSTIIAIEKDASVIACAQNNARIYGVADQITWINDDSFSYLKKNQTSIDRSKTVIFASPPWGGPNYSLDGVFNLKTMAPYSIKDIHTACEGMDSALFLPRTSNLKQIARLAPEGKKVEVVQYCMEGASKALVAYVPAAA
ncbi:Trimethylguanosine synthase [Lachnellula cervina]|uniref:Trimethylguanosine synthase n=1 Tax=Lachnellula cervina TaxID=1316786 RepID=A0A7D8YPW7_9HELO|nr:Trimethylguanosine synthase [Lachnellula cervina]